MGHHTRRRTAALRRGGATWSTAGKVAGPAATAFEAHGDDLYVSVHERGIFHSADAGTTWTQRYP